ncbi:MAG: cytochrome c oxidase subunit 3, partial [Caulobacteraceae bacterium]
MAHEGVKHDYHLVSPSPWPLFGSVAALVLTMGGVMWMKGLWGFPKHTLWMVLLGFALVITTMVCWWTDVVKEGNAGDHTPVVSLGLRYGMILFIASEVMFFSAFFWAFFDSSLFPKEATGFIWPPKG